MKGRENMNIISAIATKNKCYQQGITITPKGLMLHSIGVAQPSAKAMANAFNTYQPNGSSVCVHGFIGADGDVYQTLPWNYKAWHSGGTANSTHIGVEMTEPASIKYTGGASWTDTNSEKTKAHVLATYNTAVELFAYLCKTYNLDPTADGVIISHSEGYKRGVASNHGDVEHIWNKFGLTMDGFRKAVKAKMAENKAKTEQDEAIEFCKQYGIMNGYSKTDFGEKDPLTRGQFAIVIKRLAEKGYITVK